MHSLYFHQNNRQKIHLSPILSIIHAVTIGTMPNFNGGNNGHGLQKMLNVNRPLTCGEPFVTFLSDISFAALQLFIFVSVSD